MAVGTLAVIGLGYLAYQNYFLNGDSPENIYDFEGQSPNDINNYGSSFLEEAPSSSVSQLPEEWPQSPNEEYNYGISHQENAPLTGNVPSVQGHIIKNITEAVMDTVTNVFNTQIDPFVSVDPQPFIGPDNFIGPEETNFFTQEPLNTSSTISTAVDSPTVESLVTSNHSSPSLSTSSSITDLPSALTLGILGIAAVAGLVGKRFFNSHTTAPTPNLINDEENPGRAAEVPITSEEEPIENKTISNDEELTANSSPISDETAKRETDASEQTKAAISKKRTLIPRSKVKPQDQTPRVTALESQKKNAAVQDKIYDKELENFQSTQLTKTNFHTELSKALEKIKIKGYKQSFERLAILLFCQKFPDEAVNYATDLLINQANNEDFVIGSFLLLLDEKHQKLLRNVLNNFFKNNNNINNFTKLKLALFHVNKIRDISKTIVINAYNALLKDEVHLKQLYDECKKYEITNSASLYVVKTYERMMERKASTSTTSSSKITVEDSDETEEVIDIDDVVTPNIEINEQEKIENGKKFITQLIDDNKFHLIYVNDEGERGFRSINPEEGMFYKSLLNLLNNEEITNLFSGSKEKSDIYTATLKLEKGLLHLKQQVLNEPEKLNEINNAFSVIILLKALYHDHLIHEVYSSDMDVISIRNNYKLACGENSTFIPWDLKISLLDILMKSKITENKEDFRKAFSAYLKVANSLKKEILESDSKEKADEYGKCLFSVMATARQVISDNYADEILAKQLFNNLSSLTVLLGAKIGLQVGIEPIINSIGASSEKSTQKNVIVTHDEYLTVEEEQYIEEGFVRDKRYGIFVKNVWEEQEGIHTWKGIVKSKNQDGTYKTIENNLDVNFGERDSKEEKTLLSFLKEFCIKKNQGLKFTHVKISDAPIYLRPTLNSEDDFWNWIDSGQPENHRNYARYTALVKSTQNDYDEIVNVCQIFSQNLHAAMGKILTDTTHQSLDQQEMNVSMMLGRPLVVTKDRETTNATSWRETFTNSFSNAAAGVVSYGVGSLTGVVKTFLQSPNLPDWAKDKYRVTLKTVFDSQLLKNYSSSQTPLDKWVSQIFSAKEEKNTNPQAAHQKFLASLRNTLASDEYKTELANYKAGRPCDPIVLVVLQLCNNIYAENNIYPFCEHVICELLPTSNAKLEEKDFKKIDRNKSLKLPKADVTFKKLMGHINADFDPHLDGNLPFVLGSVNIGDKHVKLLRMGSPTIEILGQYAEINPEFIGYMESLRLDVTKGNEGKKHLYISLQNDKPKGILGGDESARNKAIKELQERFPKNFFAVVLAQDSNFYKQIDKNGVRLPTQNAKEFSQELYNQMLKDPNSGFYFPEEWKADKQFKQGVDQLLRNVKEIVFGDKADLTRQEKQDFIEIFYAYLAIFLAEYSKTDNLNITCKDAIDRAGKLNSLVLKLIMTIQGNANNSKYQRIHQVLTHFPAFWVKSQAIIRSHSKDTSNGRRERLMSAYQVMTDNDISKRIQTNLINGKKIISLGDQDIIDFKIKETQARLQGFTKDTSILVISDEEFDDTENTSTSTTTTTSSQPLDQIVPFGTNVPNDSDDENQEAIDLSEDN